jgi:hypothetical protein
MTSFARLAAAAALAGVVAAPAAAQYNPYPTPQYQYPAYPGQGYPQQYPQQYPPQYPQNYPGQPYGYGQNPVGDIIDQLLGNRYSVTDRQAVRQCARAATVQARNQYGGYGGGYNQGYGYRQGYGQGIAAPMMRVTAITDVQRRSNGLRVRGLISTGAYGGYNQGYGYQGYAGDPRYAQAGDLSFRCTVDYRGYVTNVRITPSGGYRRY